MAADADSPPPEHESAGTAAWGALLKVHAALVPILDRRLQNAVGLPLPWYDVLLELHYAPHRRLSMSDLGDRVAVSRTRVSRIVDEMVGAGLVTRAPHPTDRRSTFAEVTSAGRRRLRAAAPVYLAGIDEYFARHLSTRELTTMAAALERVRAAAVLSRPPAPDVRR